MNAKRVVVLCLALVFLLTTALVLAAGDSWVVIKDKNGICKVIKAQEKTPKTIAGPFKTKEEAEKAKVTECAKAEGSTKGKATDLMEKAKAKAKDKVDKAKKKVKDKPE